MKYLKIEDNKAFYCCDENQNWQEIDKINREDLLNLLNKAIETEFEMDEYTAELIGNKAHQIIYKNIFQKFTELLKNKNRFKDESSTLYKNAIEKYQDDSIL